MLERPWLPARRADGARSWIRPAEITSDIDRNPVVAIEWSRADFDAAAREFLISLLAVACFAQARDDWARWFASPPVSDELDRAFAPLHHAFSLDGNGPRFLQDVEPLDGEAVPVSQLLIEAPGANALKKNLDHFVRRGRIESLSRAGATMALFTLQAYAPSGGAGHRVGARGGGPLTTLVWPEALGSGAAAAVPLWHALWMNVPVETDDKPPRAIDASVLPWLGPTRTSETGQTTTPQDVHPLQALWGMPRRIRLDFERNAERRPCDLTGLVDDIIVRTYRTRPYGTNYAAFRHPLSPHYRSKGSQAEWLPVHGQPGRIGWRHWLGLMLSDLEETRQPARIVAPIARQRLRAVPASRWHRNRARLLAAGYDMDNMKARDFIESEMPLHLLDNEAMREYEPAVRELVSGGRAAESILGIAVRNALFGGEAPDAESGVRAAARSRFWDATEKPFLNIIADLADKLAGEDDEVAIRGLKVDLRDRWHAELRRQAVAIFDALVPLDGLDALDLREMQRRIDARRYLTVSLAGRGKSGDSFFKALGKPSPEPADKVKKAPKRRRVKTGAADDRPEA